jgi:pimeloyl-ACP methyl ester carboxylesterase
MPRSRWLSFTAARDRCHRRSFTSAGLRPAFFPLTDGATVHIWVPASPAPSSRPPLVLLHGFGACATWQWNPFLRPLIRAGFDLYVPDLLFFGDSSSPAADRSDIYQARCALLSAWLLASSFQTKKLFSRGTVLLSPILYSMVRHAS